MQPNLRYEATYDTSLIPMSCGLGMRSICGLFSEK